MFDEYIMKLEELHLETYTPTKRIDLLQYHPLSQKEKNRLPSFYKEHQIIPTLEKLNCLCDACDSISALTILQDYIAEWYEIDDSDEQVEKLNHKIDRKILDVQAPSVYKTMLWDICSLTAVIFVIFLICLK